MKINKLVFLGLVTFICLVVMLRVGLLSLPTLNLMAKSEVYNEVFENISNSIDGQYPDVYCQKKDALAKASYEKYLKKNKRIIDAKISDKIREKKSFYQNDNNYTYIFGVDSYYWLRLIDNLINKGRIADKAAGAEYYDNLAGVPIEGSLSKSAHIILGSVIYKIFGLLKLNVDYEVGLYIIPLLLSVLLVIFTFFTARLLSQSNIAAFFASIAINFSPLFLQRTLFEWLDTDIYSVLFPVLIFGMFVFVFKSQEVVKKSLAALVFSLSCALYAGVWQGWWHIFDILILSGLVFILNDYFLETRDKVIFKKNILWLALLFICGVAIVGLVNGRESLFSFISGPKNLIFTLKDVPQDNWPNVFLTVAELKKINPYTLCNEVGGLFLFFVAVLGSVYLVLSKKILRDKESGMSYFCLFIWLGVLYYASLNAIRLALLLIVPAGIMFGIAMDIMFRKIFNTSVKFSKRIHFSVLGAMILLVYLFFYSYLAQGIDLSYKKLPLINDAWYKSLEFIKKDSSQDAVINSWWDYGHWFTAVAKRRVLFDGKTQNSPVAFWMARVLTTDDEKEAAGILRILDISKNKAFDLLESYGFSHAQAVEILCDISKLSKADARNYLSQTLSEEKISELMPLLYQDNMPAAYLIVSFDMMMKMRSISHIGNWDFKKGDIWLHFSSTNPPQFVDYLKKQYGYDKKEISSLLKDLSLFNEKEALGWISRVDNIYPNSFSNKFKAADNLAVFDNALTLDLSNYNAYIVRGPDIDIGIPYSVVYLKDRIPKENILSGSNLEYSVAVMKDKDSFKSIFLDKDLTQSMFSRMYFFKGEGLKYFKKVSEEKTPEGNYIFVYKIEWPK